jgi:hypothetical protein
MVIAPVIAIDSLGVGTFRTVIPNDPSLITGHYFTQMWAIDLPANPLGMTFSNGVNTQIGGNRWPRARRGARQLAIPTYSALGLAAEGRGSVPWARRGIPTA